MMMIQVILYSSHSYTVSSYCMQQSSGGLSCNILGVGILLSVEGSPRVNEADVTLRVCVSVFGQVPDEAQATLTTVDDTAKGKHYSYITQSHPESLYIIFKCCGLNE